VLAPTAISAERRMSTLVLRSSAGVISPSPGSNSGVGAMAARSDWSWWAANRRSSSRASLTAGSWLGAYPRASPESDDVNAYAPQRARVAERHGLLGVQMEPVPRHRR
jgi:hypothetical protein